MNHKLFIGIKIVIFVFFCGLLTFIGKDVELLSLKSLIESLLTVASVILAIIGIWLAIVYPEIITKIFRNEGSKENSKLLKQARKLLSPLILTSLIIVTIIIYRTVDVLPGDGTLFGSKQLVSGLTFCYISIVSILLIYSLIMSISPGLQLYFDAKDQDESDKEINSLDNK